MAFKPLPGFRARHIGMFEQQLDGYTDYDEKPELAPPGTAGPALQLSSEHPLPRVWFGTPDGEWLVQLQRDRLVTNWRAAPDRPYPRFPAVYARFVRHLTAFTAFAQTHQLGPLAQPRFELTYIGHLASGEGWDRLEQLGAILPDLAWRARADRVANGMKSLEWRAVFSPESFPGELLMRLFSAHDISANRPVLVLELSAQGPAPAADATHHDEWFHPAHELLVLAFQELTDADVQTGFWGRVR
ncbi:MAG: hypothetical protein HYU66_14675 [Armatimonadetes bacterium]|nr:hypothetical protein [Armatimonadota bacterium]